MNALDYRTQAENTLAPETQFFIKDADDIKGLHASMGICTELGEILKAIEVRRVDLINLSEEIGDVLWYVSIIERKHNFILEVNEDQLAALGFDSTVSLVNDSLVEANELLDLYKKRAFYGKPVDAKLEVKAALRIFTNMCLLSDAIGISIPKIRETNIRKLAARYPDKFTTQDALNRDLGAERTILEGVNEPA